MTSVHQALESWGHIVRKAESSQFEDDVATPLGIMTIVKVLLNSTAKGQKGHVLQGCLAVLTFMGELAEGDYDLPLLPDSPAMRLIVRGDKLNFREFKALIESSGNVYVRVSAPDAETASHQRIFVLPDGM